MGKTPFAGSGVIADIPAQHRLGLGNPTFRGNTMIPEGQSSDTAIIPQATGVLVQDLPFTIMLKKFTIDFYSTGMPKLFASDVVIRDHETGKTFPATIEVNKPLIYKGVAVYQSSFEDGGSKLKLTGFPMAGADSKPFALAGEVNSATDLKRGDEQYSVEWSGFRPFNVENIGGQDVRAVAKGQSLNEQFSASLDKHSGSAAKNANNKDLKNVGPSVQYKLRDKTGQAREFQNYMQPVTIDGAQVFLAGMRISPADPFSFLRIPADDEHSVREWMRLRAALADPALRAAGGAALREARDAGQRQRRRAGAGGPAEGVEREDAGHVRRRRQAGRLHGGGRLHRRAEGAGGGAAQRRQHLPQDAQRQPVGAVAGRARTRRPGRRSPPTTTTRASCSWPPTRCRTASSTARRSTCSSTSSSRSRPRCCRCRARPARTWSTSAACSWCWACSRCSTSANAGCGSGCAMRRRRGSHALMAMSTQRKTLDFEHEFNDMKAKLPQSA